MHTPINKLRSEFLLCLEMSRILSSGNAITYVMIIFLVFLTKTHAEARFNFTKLTFQWPESFCNRQRVHLCTMPIPTSFAIRSFIPMYLPDIKVPPYAQNPSCTTSTTEPADSAFITEESLVEAGIKDDMVKYWPDLLNPNGIHFWQSRWEENGRCFDYFDDDMFHYFKVAMALAVSPQMDLLQILRRATPTITPSPNGRKLSGISTALYNHFHVQVEIHCNADTRNLFQLSAITICIKNDATYMDCPGDYHYCPPNRDRTIYFPYPSQVRT